MTYDSAQPCCLRFKFGKSVEAFGDFVAWRHETMGGQHLR